MVETVIAKMCIGETAVHRTSLCKEVTELRGEAPPGHCPPTEFPHGLSLHFLYNSPFRWFKAPRFSDGIRSYKLVDSQLVMPRIRF